MGASKRLGRLKPFGAGTLMDVPVALLGEVLLTETALERFYFFVDQEEVLQTALTRKFLAAILKLA